MGIRFACHHCSHAIHVKDFQGGKRGKCPACKGSFRIPFENSTYSLVVEEELVSPAANNANQAVNNIRNAFEQASAPVVAKKPVESRSESSRSKSPSRESAENMTSPAAVTERSWSQPTTASDSQLERSQHRCKAFVAAPGAQWFVRPPSGGQYGPADDSLLTQWIEESRVTPESLLWREGQSHWMTARELLPELYESSPDLAVPPIVKSPLIDARARDNALAVKETGGGYTLPVDGKASSIPMGRDATPDARLGEPAIARGEIPDGLGPRSSSLLAQRKAKRRKQQWLAIVSLGIVSVVLLVGLVAVLLLR